MEDYDNHDRGQEEPALPDIGKLKLIGTTLCLPDDEEGEMMIFAQLTGYWPNQIAIAEKIVERVGGKINLDTLTSESMSRIAVELDKGNEAIRQGLEAIEGIKRSRPEWFRADTTAKSLGIEGDEKREICSAMRLCGGCGIVKSVEWWIGEIAFCSESCKNRWKMFANPLSCQRLIKPDQENPRRG